MDYVSEWAEGEHPYGDPAPCPHCGERQNFTELYFNGPGPPPSYVFACGHCGATGPHGYGRERGDHYGARQDAIVKWNQRTPAKAIEAGTAETGTGSVHESAVPQGFAQEIPHD